MIQVRFKNTYFYSVSMLLFLVIFTMVQNSSFAQVLSDKSNSDIVVAANRFNDYLPLLKNKNIAVVANQTSVVNFKVTGAKGNATSTIHLVDFLQKMKINIVKVFSPEHGFRGKADAAEHIADGVDKKSGLPITSLYGKNKKPSQKQLSDIDIVVFDIQDVGVRFYTYISTLHYVMEACAEKKIPVIVLDRPNPNGHYVDGPVLEMEYKSFVGMHPVPLVYGMTIGEYAQMINGENWLMNDLNCDLTVIQLENYTHQSVYSLPIRPSPNLPNDKSINLYPSLGFFEGTTINAGRGTEFQFQRYGSPHFSKSEFTYIPEPNFGSKYPKNKGEVCNGVDLKDTPKLNKVDISFLVDAYQKSPNKEKFFGKTFTAHAGTKKLQQQLEKGKSIEKIRVSWEKDLNSFKTIRAKYLIYN